MKTTRMLLTCVLAAGLGLQAVSDEPGVVRIETPPSVIIQNPDGTIVCKTDGEPVDLHDAKRAAAQNNALGFVLYRELAKDADHGDNLFFSPISITAAMSLTYEGARGDTLTEFNKVLHVPEGQARPAYHGSLAKLMNNLDGEDKPYDLTIANSLWGERTMPFAKPFLRTLNKHYEAGFSPANFIADPDGERQKINQWVEDNTNKRIKDLLPPGSIDELTRLVLANAIYFKGDWVYSFDKRATRDRDFQIPPGPTEDAPIRRVKTPVMAMNNKPLRYADLDGLDILELPYKGDDLSMLVLLPDDINGLPTLEAELSAESLAKWRGALKRERVSVAMPKWEATQSYGLVKPMQRLGMSDAFDPDTANFTGMTDSAEGEGLYISGIFHKAFIKVDEKGSEAAAATAVVVANKSAVIEPAIAFVADRPFVYMIVDNDNGAVLFLGRVMNPSAE